MAGGTYSFSNNLFEDVGSSNVEFQTSIKTDVSNYNNIKEGIPMFTITNVLFITIVSLLAYKFILPRLNLKWVFTKAYRWMFKPIDKFSDNVVKTIKEIKEEDKE